MRAVVQRVSSASVRVDGETVGACGPGHSRRQRGTRPDFSQAAPKEQAEPLYQRFCDELRALGVPVETGVFGAYMEVEIVNDGPVTIVLEVEP